MEIPEIAVASGDLKVEKHGWSRAGEIDTTWGYQVVAELSEQSHGLRLCASESMLMRVIGAQRRVPRLAVCVCAYLMGQTRSLWRYC